jgi:hypothetical protein
MKTKTVGKTARPSQREKFIEAARKHGASEDEALFDENLKKIAKPRPKEKSPE